MIHESTLDQTCRKACERWLEPFVEELSPSAMSFPLVSHTFSVWRRAAYQHLINDIRLSHAQQQQQLNLCFFRYAELGYRESFIKQIIEGTSLFSAPRPSDQSTQENMNRKLLQLNTLKRLWIELIADLTNLPYLPQLQKYRQRQLVDILKDKIPKSNESKRQMLTNWVKGQALKQVIGLSARTIMLTAAKTLYWPLLLFNPFVFGSEFLAYRTERKVKSIMALAKEENDLKDKIAELSAVNSNLEVIHKTLLALIGKHLNGSDRLCLIEELLESVYNGESDHHEEFHMSIDSDRDNS